MTDNRKFRWRHPAYTELRVRFAFTDPPDRGSLERNYAV